MRKNFLFLTLFTLCTCKSSKELNSYYKDDLEVTKPNNWNEYEEHNYHCFSSKEIGDRNYPLATIIIIKHQGKEIDSLINEEIIKSERLFQEVKFYKDFTSINGRDAIVLKAFKTTNDKKFKVIYFYFKHNSSVYCFKYHVLAKEHDNYKNDMTSVLNSINLLD